MIARTNDVRTIRDVQSANVVALDFDGGDASLIASGHLADFRCVYGDVRSCTGGVVISPKSARALEIAEDATVCHVARV